MKAKEIAAELMKKPENEVWCGAYNGHVETYGVVDHVYSFRYDQVSNDFFGTPGRMDKRLFRPRRKDDEEIFFIGTLFGRVPMPDIDFGDDDIDYEISKINGEDGDPDLVWKMSGFSCLSGSKEWTKEGDGWKVVYNTADQTLDAHNYRDGLRFVGKVIGIETLCNALKVCKINAEIRC